MTSITWNILQGRNYIGTGRNLEGLCETIKEHKFHVVGMSESDSIHPWTQSLDSIGWLSVCLGYHSRYGLPVSSLTWNAGMLSAYKLRNCKTHTLPHLNDWMYNYPITICKVILMVILCLDFQIQFNKTEVTVINTYTTFWDVENGGPKPYNVDAIQAQATYVAEQASSIPGPVILTGDFNTLPNSSSYQTYINAGLQDAYYTMYHEFPDRTAKTKVVDYIFFKELKLVDVKILKNGVDHLSNHRPIIAHFSME